MMHARQWQALTLLCGILAASAAVPAPVSAASIVVGPSGFATIQQAVNNAAPGTAIVIAPGTYAESVDLSAMGSASGAGNGNLALVARDGPGSVTLGGSGVKLGNSGTFDGTLVVDGLLFSSSNDDAIRLSSFTNLVIADCTFQSIGDDTEDSAVEIALIAGDPQVALLKNTFGLGSGTTAALGSAVRVDATESAAPIITVQDNSLSEPGPRPLSFPRLFLTLLGAGGTITVRDNTLTNIASSGIVVQLGEDGDKAVSISDNVMTGLQSVPIDVTAAPGGAVDATIADNRITDSAANAIELDTNAAVSANISGNQITNVSGSGIVAGARGVVTSDVAASLALEGNTITRAGRNGIRVLAAGSSAITAAVRNNRIEQPANLGGLGDFGFNAGSTPTGDLTLAINQNTFGADQYGRSVALAEEAGSVARIEGDSALSVQENVANDNTLGGSVALDSELDVVARGTITPPSAPPQLQVEDDAGTALPAETTTIEVLDNDTGGSAPSLEFVAPVSVQGASASATDTVNYTSAAGFQGSDELYYVASVGTVTGVGRISVSVRRTLPGSPRSLNVLHFIPLVGNAQ